jgi:hypothetical protein
MSNPILYVTEMDRVLDSTCKIQQLRAVYAYVSNSPDDIGIEKRYSPDEWNALLENDGVMYRHRDEPFRRISNNFD